MYVVHLLSMEVDVRYCSICEMIGHATEECKFKRTKYIKELSSDGSLESIIVINDNREVLDGRAKKMLSMWKAWA